MILRDLVREMDFQCVVTQRANDALVAASRFEPSAILLDLRLPDHSGLGVLDQLKRNPQTRHIPVHVVSVSDYKQEALELGAVGYALKPAKREQLIDALRRLEAKFSQKLRRVLVVEDDARQRESISSCSPMTACRSPAWKAPARRSGHSRPRRSIAWWWTSICRITAATTCSKKWRSGTAGHFRPSSSTPGAR